MKIIEKKEFQKLIEEYPDGGIVFTAPGDSTLLVTDGEYGATEVIPYQGEIFSFDWSINDYANSDYFYIYDNNDVLQMIKTLTSGLKIKLEGDY